MKITKRIIKIVAALLAILLPIGLILTITLMMAPQFEHTFLGALDEKYERLNSIEEEKIIVVGGSSVAFGLDSEQLEEYVGMPVVNFGLYAALGTKAMLDLSRSNINEGDVVVIAPELSPQTMSMYFSTENTLMALEGDISMFFHIDINNKFSLVSGLVNFIGKKIGYALNGKPNPDGIYNSASFNEYGDIKANLRSENEMELYYDPNTPINLDESLLNDDFIDYLNDYIKYCKSQGATVCFAFCPMNEMAIESEKSEAAYREFEKMLSESISCNVISYLDDYILDAGYFYDSNFHLNDTGVRYRTLRLAEDILLELGVPRYISDTYPEPPKLPGEVIILDGVDENEKYFTFEKLAGGNYMITGLTALGKEQKALTLPLGVQIGSSNMQIAVTAIGKGAFDGSVVEELTIPDNSRLRQFINDAFDGAGSLKRINLHIKNAEKVLPPATFSGVHADFKLYVPKGSDYMTDYFWSQIKVNIVEDL